jgi:hypothetical protein
MQIMAASLRFEVNMIRALVKMTLLSLPFLIIGAGLIFYGFIKDERALTDDGYSSKTFLFAMGGFFIGLTLLLNAVMLVFAINKGRRIKEIVTYGKPGTAKILKLEDTGVRVNENPRVKLLLEISIPNYPTYQAKKTLDLSIVDLPRVQPGSIVNILADPEDKSNEDRIGLIL